MSAKVFTVEHFYEFCKSRKSPQQGYDYPNAAYCACGQYCTSLGFDYRQPSVGHRPVFEILEILARIPPWTWEALTRRVKDYLEDPDAWVKKFYLGGGYVGPIDVSQRNELRRSDVDYHRSVADPDVSLIDNFRRAMGQRYEQRRQLRELHALNSSERIFYYVVREEDIIEPERERVEPEPVF
jgi:hypothetical protein